jgi:alpha-mannosidase
MYIYTQSICFFLFFLISITFSIKTQAESKRIYIAPDDHTDYLWTADEETYRKAFIEMLDYYLDAADATEDNPSYLHSRWNCDGSFWMWTYERNKEPVQFERLISRIRDGHISVPLNALVSCYGGVPAEAVIRGLYYSGRIERRYNLRFPLAVAMENQTLPFGLGALWAGAGARYSWRGICACATQIPDAGDREHEIYWWIGLDGSRILMKWNSLYQHYGTQKHTNQGIGGYAEARFPEEVIEFVDTDNQFQKRYRYPIIGAFGQGWDDLKTMDQSFVTAARKKNSLDRRVIVSNEEDFFSDFERHFGDMLPELSASFGNEWDLLCASMAEVSAKVKRALTKLRAAEAMATLISLHNPAFLHGRESERDQCFMNLGLYWEHDWTADGPVPRNQRAAWQRKLADQITMYVDTLHADARSSLGRMIARTGKQPCYYVFNPLSWVRTDAVDLPYASDASVHVIDLTTGRETPSQEVILNNGRFLRIFAQDVPAVGYKVFEIRDGAGKVFTPAANVKQTKLENKYYRITLNKYGAITSLIDKRRNYYEVVGSAKGAAINKLIGKQAGPSPEAKLVIENKGPVSVTLKAESDHPLKHTTHITLLRDSSRIEIQNHITQNFDEVLTWDSSFNFNEPDVHHEECGAILHARLLPEGGHYSPRNARYDWLTINHFVDISDREKGIVLSNADCYFMRLGNSTTSFLDTTKPTISILAGGQIDGPNLGIRKQGGDNRFLQRFALTTREVYNPAVAMRFALEHQNPLVAAPVSVGPSDTTVVYPNNSYSFMQLSNPSVLLWTLKPAEEGMDNGIIARFWNLNNSAAQCRVSLDCGLSKVWQVTHIETNLKKVDLKGDWLATKLSSQQLQTYRLFPRVSEQQSRSNH